MIVKCWKRDGSCIVRKIKGWNNPYKYALQVLDSHALDIYYNQMSTGKDNTVIMGVEIDSYGKPVAYHFKQSVWQVPAHANIPSASYERVRIPASEIQHIYKREQPGQTEGIPSASSCIINLQMLRGYSEAEITAARMQACKMLFYITTGNDPDGDGQGSDGRIQKIFAPGGSDILPPGVEPKLIDPTHPNAAYAAFVKAQLREISSGLGVAYNNLANDLEGVNYSSMRHGRNDEVDAWKREQTFVIDHFCKPIFSEWLWCYLALSGKSFLPLKKYEKFNAPIFVPRSFEWVDPKSDAEAKLLLMSKGLESPLDIGQALGKDTYRIIDEIAAVQAYAKSKGVDINLLQAANQTVQTISKTEDKPNEAKT
jgi:lambda family phage portal protein